ncbi:MULTISPECIES: hypothetical protein [Pseudoalteromonas]|uniref:hypothetical protein n=1 Tax=Pseudoalteromonas TaxID=53246 RepID=UPI001582C13F|nr:MULTISPECIES: hypothetical protein [Pseudoalteromonas]MDI4653619.1 hypothetical protein [Pseudoalteromonas shioyasakiensis]NUJ39346.1 hypothetical protein [Pseudoalteromonas sp. 0303]
MSKPVTDLVAMLESAFEVGECSCIRCKSGEDETKYKNPHNFMIKGITYHRLFAKSSDSDLDSKFRSAWKASIKDVEFSEKFSINQLKDVLGSEHLELFNILGLANGYIKRFEDDEYELNLP